MTSMLLVSLSLFMNAAPRQVEPAEQSGVEGQMGALGFIIGELPAGSCVCGTDPDGRGRCADVARDCTCGGTCIPCTSNADCPGADGFCLIESCCGIGVCEFICPDGDRCENAGVCGTYSSCILGDPCSECQSSASCVFRKLVCKRGGAKLISKGVGAPGEKVCVTDGDDFKGCATVNGRGKWKLKELNVGGGTHSRTACGTTLSTTC